MTNPPAIGTIGVTPTFGNQFDRFVARSIQWFTATRGSYSGTDHASAVDSQVNGFRNAPVNHAVVYVGPIPGYAKPQLVQAQPGGAGFADWDSYGDSMIWLDHIGQEVPAGQGVGGSKLGPILTPTDNQRQVIKAYAVDCAVKQIGYNYLDFLAIGLAQRRFGELGEHWDVASPWWVKRLSNDNRLICSQLADAAWHAAGLDIFADKRPAGLVSPEDLYLAGGAPSGNE